MSVHRRTVLTGMLGASALVAAPAILRAQGAPTKIGFLTVKTGPLASGGIQMEQGLTLYLKERNNVLAGRPVQLFTGDSGGAPAVARTKMQEFVEKENIACLIGPLATAEALAIDDYIRDKQVPTLSVAAAEDMTQRKANPWFVRATSSSAQCSYAMGDYAAKELGYKRAAMIADDLAYGHELNAGFQRAFEDAGGKVVQKLWPPLVSPDYGTYIAQLKQNVDVIFIGFAGSNGFKFFKQYKEYGGNTPILGGMTAVDEALLQQMGDEALGMISTCWYSAQIDTPANKKFVEAYKAKFGKDRVTDDPIEAGYFGVYLWSKAVEKANSVEVDKVKEAAKNLEFDAPGGKVKLDEKNQHTWKTVRIGKVRADGQFDEVWNSGKSVQPDPYLEGYDWAKDLKKGR